MPIDLPPDTTEALIHSLQRYAEEELEHPLSALQARWLLDFILAEVGPSVYNRAIADAQRYLQERALDLGSTCYEPELTYWHRRRG